MGVPATLEVYEGALHVVPAWAGTPEARDALHRIADFVADLLPGAPEPDAAAADDPTRGVDPDHLARLARAGLESVTMPVAEGGHGASSRVDAEVVELLSGGCGATWFLTTQHRFPQQLSRGSLPDLDPAAIRHGPAAESHRAALAGATERAGMALWREKLFAWMMRNAESAMDFFKLPTNRVVELGSQVEI